MECHNFIWEGVLEFFSFQERLDLRLLSKTFNRLVLITLTDLVLVEDDDYHIDIVERFSPYTRHLLLDVPVIDLKKVANKFMNLNSITLRNGFDLHYCENYSGKVCNDCEENEAILILQERKLSNISLLLQCSNNYTLNIISGKELSGFAFSFDHSHQEPDIVLKQLSYRRLRSLRIYGAPYDRQVLSILKENAKNLHQLELARPRLINNHFKLPEIHSLRFLQVYLDDEQDISIWLNNPEKLPNLRQLDIFQETYDVKFNIDKLEVWPQLKSLRIDLRKFQAINFKKYFPNLKELSYNLESASLSQTRDFFASIDHVSYLFINCPDEFVVPKSANFELLTRLKLTFGRNIRDGLEWISNGLPNLIELSVISNNWKFESIFLDTKCHFRSLMRYDSQLEPNSIFWSKFIIEAPRLIEIGVQDWSSEARVRFQTSYPRISVRPHYDMENGSFPEFTYFD